MKRSRANPKRHSKPNKPSWNAHQLRLLAVHAGVDPRTAKRWLVCDPLSSTCAARLDEAWKRLHADGALPALPEKGRS